MTAMTAGQWVRIGSRRVLQWHWSLWTAFVALIAVWLFGDSAGIVRAGIVYAVLLFAVILWVTEIVDYAVSAVLITV